MKKFIVTLSRKVRESVEVPVEAETENEAVMKALKLDDDAGEEIWTLWNFEGWVEEIMETVAENVTEANENVEVIA